MVEYIDIVKYREIPNNFCLVSRFALKVMLIFKLAVIIFNLFGYSIYVFNIPQYLVTYVYDVILIILGVCSFSLVQKYKYVLLSILGLLIAIMYGTNVIFYNETTVYNEYTSSIDNTKIVTKSNGYLFSGKTKFYIQKGIVLKNTKVNIELDEGYQQIRNAQIDIVWEDSLATFNYYDSDTNSLILSKSIPF